MDNKAAIRSKYIRAGFELSDENQDSSEWLMAAIISYACDAVEPQRTWKLLRHLKSISSPEHFREFKDNLTILIYPMVITEHGYKKSLGSRDQADAWRQIQHVSKTLSDLGYESFINSGTLLGAIREGKLLAHDDDADLGVMIPGNTLNEVVERTIELMLSLADLGMLSSWHVENGCKHISLRTELQMDLFPCWEQDGEIFAYPHGKIEKGSIFPLKYIEMEGQRISIPASAVEFLSLCYGEDWRVPDDTYTYPWGRSVSHFVEYNEKFDRLITQHMSEIITRAKQK